MKKQNRTIVAVLGVIAIGVAVALFSLPDGGAKDDGDGKPQTSLRKKKGSEKKTGKKRKGRGRPALQSHAEREKDVQNAVGDDEEENLTPELRKVLQTIRDASDNEDKEALIRLMRRLQNMEGWPDSVPVLIRNEALDALGWIGSECLPEIMGFLSDPDEDVVQTASSYVSDAVADVDISDKERSKLLLMAARVVNDSDTMESVLFELNNMRNSVAVDTIKNLWISANSTTRPLLAEAVESVTGEEGIDTPQKLDAWLAKNLDDEGE